MYISRKWLSDHVNIPDKISHQDLANKLTMSSSEIEGIEDQTEKFAGVVVGEILEINKHPDADKLKLAIVDVGTQKLDIVCGAPNIEVGQKVPVALVGSTLPNGLTLEEVEIRGQKSYGMMCAEDELGIGEDHSGIMILDEKAKVGVGLAKYLGLEDAIFEIDNKTITHRPDLWSHYGIAREVAALYKQPFNPYKVKDIEISTKKDIKDCVELEVHVDDKKLCPRYMGVVLEDIIIKESPDWLKGKLIAAGVRPINNIVDITNFVMMDIGQPLHAFDYDKLEDKKIIVRNAKPGEKIKTLDDENRTLNKNILVIADGKKPVAIAGVMGGANSEIDDKTKRIVIESANFDFVSVRKTSMELGLRTEASMRFEKSLDPNVAELGIKKAVELILEICPEAQVISKLEDVADFKLNQGPIVISINYLHERIGEHISEGEIVKILTSLGFSVSIEDGNLEITVPTWRATKDISIADDIVEEVARIYGFDNIENKLPKVAMQSPSINKERYLERKLKEIFTIGYDMTEVLNYSFTSDKQIHDFELSKSKFIRVTNPQSQNVDFMRRSLVPNLIDNVKQNLRFYDNFNLLEVGSVFQKEKQGPSIDGQSKKFLPLQDKYISGVVVEKGNEQPFYVIKNYVEQALKQLRYNYELVKADKEPFWSSKMRCQEVVIDGEKIGYIGELGWRFYHDFGIKTKIGIFELNFEKLLDKFNHDMNYHSIPKYPSIELDWSFIIDKHILWQEVYDQVSQVNKDFVKEIKLVDVFEGKGVPDEKKSMAFRVTYRSDSRTLAMDEVEVIHKQIANTLEKIFTAKIRK